MFRSGFDDVKHCFEKRNGPKKKLGSTFFIIQALWDVSEPLCVCTSVSGLVRLRASALLDLGIQGYSPGSFWNSPGSLCRQIKKHNDENDSPVEYTFMWLHYQHHRCNIVACETRTILTGHILADLESFVVKCCKFKVCILSSLSIAHHVDIAVSCCLIPF